MSRTNNKLTKSAQMSIFVIITTIIVVAGVLFFSYNSDSIHLFTSEKSSYKIKQFVEDCLEVETNNAVNQIGLHGGWLYHPEMKFAKIDENKYTVKSSKGFDYFGVEIPYWYYYDDSQESFNTRIPEYDTENRYSLKNQVKKYLDDNLEKNCIKSFSSFDKVYDIKYEPKEINTKVIFNGEKIEVNLNLPLQINEINSNNSEYIDTFIIREENKLRVPYFLARDIVNIEINNSFVEKSVLNFISAYQSTSDKSLLPPFYDFKMIFDKKPWKVPEVEKLTKEVISSNIDILQFSQTDYTQRKIPKELQNNDFARKFYSNYNTDILDTYSLVQKENPSLYREYRNYKVKPSYEVFYPTYFSLAPSFGDVVLFPKAEAIFNLLPFFFTEYSAVYEIAAPIIFEIKSNDQKDNFVFNLAIEINIDHNTPLKENYQFSLNVDEIPIDNNRNLICEPSQFISAPVYLNITDPVNFGNRTSSKDPIVGVSDAYVSFTCKNMATCYIGTTQMNGEIISKNITELAFRLPINCNPGKLEIYKFGHRKIIIDNLNPTIENPISLGEISMPSKKNFELKIKLVNPTKSRVSSGKVLDAKDSAFLIFENLDDSDIVEVVEISYENQYNLSIDLMPGNYSLQGFVIHNAPVHIPSQEFCYDKGIIFSDEECQTIPELNMESWVRGGIELQEFNITQNYILTRNTITVALIDFGIPTTYDELNAMSNYMGDLKGTSIGYRPYFD